MVKVIITGSNGLLGQTLLGLLLNEKESYQVIGFSKGKNRSGREDFNYVSIDLTKKENLKEKIQEIQPDFIVNTAAMTQVDDCETNKEDCNILNVEVVKWLVEISKEINAHLVHLSTDFIFDGLAGPYAEEALAHPLSYYGKSKLASEDLLKASPVKSAIVRTVLVYGIAHDMSKSNIILWVKHSLEQGKKIQVINDQWRTPTLAEDLALGCMAIAQKKAEGIFNLSGKDLLTPHEMALKTAHFFKLDASLIEEVDGSVFTQPAQRHARTGFILDKAITELNYNPHSFDEGMAILQKQLSLRSL